MAKLYETSAIVHKMLMIFPRFVEFPAKPVFSPQPGTNRKHIRTYFWTDVVPLYHVSIVGTEVANQQLIHEEHDNAKEKEDRSRNSETCIII